MRCKTKCYNINKICDPTRVFECSVYQAAEDLVAEEPNGFENLSEWFNLKPTTFPIRNFAVTNSHNDSLPPIGDGIHGRTKLKYV